MLLAGRIFHKKSGCMGLNIKQVRRFSYATVILKMQYYPIISNITECFANLRNGDLIQFLNVNLPKEKAMFNTCNIAFKALISIYILTNFIC